MTRPLSNINLALNAARGNTVLPFDPEDAGTLTVWYDFDDASTLTVVAGSPDVITDVVNKAAADTTNDALLDDGAVGTVGMEQEIARINGLDTGFSDDTPIRAMVVRDLVQTFSRVGSAGFRFFMVVETAAAETLRGFLFVNGVGDPSGGGYQIMFNDTAADQVRWAMQDGVSTSLVRIETVGLADGAPHVVMIGRSIGTGAGGVDQMVGSIDGVVPTGLPLDLASGFGAADNDGGTNASSGWLIMGAGPAAPSGTATRSRTSFGEALLYKTDMDAGTEATVVSGLKAKWGVV